MSCKDCSWLIGSKDIVSCRDETLTMVLIWIAKQIFYFPLRRSPSGPSWHLPRHWKLLASTPPTFTSNMPSCGESAFERQLLSIFALKIKRLSNKGVAGAGGPPSLLAVPAGEPVGEPVFRCMVLGRVPFWFPQWDPSLRSSRSLPLPRSNLIAATCARTSWRPPHCPISCYQWQPHMPRWPTGRRSRRISSDKCRI